MDALTLAASANEFLTANGVRNIRVGAYVGTSLPGKGRTRCAYAKTIAGRSVRVDGRDTGNRIYRNYVYVESFGYFREA